MLRLRLRALYAGGSRTKLPVTRGLSDTDALTHHNVARDWRDCDCVRNRQDQEVEEEKSAALAAERTLARPLAERARAVERAARQAREVVESWICLRRLEKNAAGDRFASWTRECRIERASAALSHRLNAALGDELDLERRVLAAADCARSDLTIMEQSAPLADDGVALDCAERSEAFSLAYERCKRRLAQRHGPGLRLCSSDASGGETSGDGGRVRLWLAW
ncbi:Hypothetical protein UVM_LOCUS144 [uncultured virus]|nr:Hypothetical protein UVM_LOCUS144 [uncultured virus]